MKGHWRLLAAAAVCAVAMTVAVAAAAGRTALTPAQRAATPPTAAAGAARAAQGYGRLAAAFVENRGQTDPRVRFYVQGKRSAVFVTPREVMLSVARPGSRLGIALALRFVGGHPRAVSGAARVPGRVNVLRGSDRDAWRAGLARYGAVVYRELWPGIDLRLGQRAGALKYELWVRPGARPSDIRLAYAGSSGLSLDRAGRLRVRTALGTLRDSAPVAYQAVGGRRVRVTSRYLVRPGGRGFGFAVGSYDRARELVIDPGIEYTTLLGGGSDEVGAGIAVDGAGNAYVTGTTQSPDFPTTPGAFRRTGAAGNNQDVFVTKLNPAGTALIYSTFVGGSKFDVGRRIAIDAAGNAYVTGRTTSSNFPTTGSAFDRSLAIPPNCPRCAAADNYDAFAFKLNPTGSALSYSTYLGGTDIDDAHGIAVDGSGSAYVTGETTSTDFPTTAGAFSRAHHGAYDVFVTKLNPTGSALAYSTFLGGSLVDDGERVAVDGAGNAYAMGFTSAADFPTTAGAFDTTANGDFDVFVTKLNPSGSAPVYSTFLGGSGSDGGGGLAVDGGGNAYVSGGTSSLNFPATAGAFDATGDGSDAFVAKLNAAGSALVSSTLLGGSGSDSATGVAPDAAGNAWLSGITSSANFPVSADAADASFNGVADAFIAEVGAGGTSLPYATYLGGSQSDGADDVARDGNGNVFVAGHTYSITFPATTGAFDTVFNGDPSIFWGDAFVTKLALAAGTSTPPAPPPVPAAPTLVSPANADTPPQPITFDWNDVPGAVSYTIQIDDSSAFTAPLVRDASVTSSIYATSGLATTTHFWRVRGVNSAGVAGAWSAVRSFTPQAPPPPAVLSTMDVNPATVAGGDGSSGTVVLSVGAPEGGAVVALSSSAPAVASVPASVTVAANDFAGVFPIATSPVSATTSVVITASYNGTTRTATLTVTAAGPPPPATLQALSVSPASVTGGAGAQGTLTLSGAAPAGGTAVSLASSNPGAASVPASVTVAGGASTATFAVATATVSTSTGVTISASAGGVTRTASLTVTPAAPPPQTATLTVSATGRSGERVSSSPAGVSVATGSTGSASFAPGTQVTLSVSNGRDAIWSGACSSGGSKTKTCTFTLSSSASVTANVQ